LPHRRVVRVAAGGIVQREAGDARALVALHQHSTVAHGLALHWVRPGSEPPAWIATLAIAPSDRPSLTYRCFLDSPTGAVSWVSRLDGEQLGLQDPARRFCAERFPLERIAERDGRSVDRAAWREMGELGVFGPLEARED